MSSRYFGKVGFKESVETAPDVWEDSIVEHPYYGDVIKNGRRLSGGGEVIQNITVTNSISIVADPYARTHFWNIAYVTWQGAKWHVSEVTEAFPRLILSLGGVYSESEED